MGSSTFKDLGHFIPHNGSQIARSSLVQSPATGFPAQVLAGVKESLPTSLSTQAWNCGDDAPSIETLEILPSGSTRTTSVDGRQAAPPHGRIVGGIAVGGVQTASSVDFTGGNGSRGLPQPWIPAATKTKMSFAVSVRDNSGLFNTRLHLQGTPTRFVWCNALFDGPLRTTE